MSLDRLLWEVDKRGMKLVWRLTCGGWACSRLGDDLHGPTVRGRTGADALCDLLGCLRRGRR